MYLNLFSNFKSLKLLNSGYHLIRWKTNEKRIIHKECKYYVLNGILDEEIYSRNTNAKLQSRMIYPLNEYYLDSKLYYHKIVNQNHKDIFTLHKYFKE